MFFSIIANLVHREPYVFYSVVAHLEKGCQLCLVHCLKKLSGIYEPQDLEPERDKVLHDELDDTDGVEPNNSRLRSIAGS